MPFISFTVFVLSTRRNIKQDLSNKDLTLRSSQACTTHSTRLPQIACRIYADLCFCSHYFYVTATKRFGETTNVFLNLSYVFTPNGF